MRALREARRAEWQARWGVLAKLWEAGLCCATTPKAANAASSEPRIAPAPTQPSISPTNSGSTSSSVPAQGAPATPAPAPAAPPAPAPAPSAPEPESPPIRIEDASAVVSTHSTPRGGIKLQPIAAKEVPTWDGGIETPREGDGEGEGTSGGLPPPPRLDHQPTAELKAQAGLFNAEEPLTKAPTHHDLTLAAVKDAAHVDSVEARGGAAGVSEA